MISHSSLLMSSSSSATRIFLSRSTFPPSSFTYLNKSINICPTTFKRNDAGHLSDDQHVVIIELPVRSESHFPCIAVEIGEISAVTAPFGGFGCALHLSAEAFRILQNLIHFPFRFRIVRKRD